MKQPNCCATPASRCGVEEFEEYSVTTEILINVAPRENRAALIENGVLTELFVERQSRRGIVSNLYK
jgi:hypothetical protein